MAQKRRNKVLAIKSAFVSVAEAELGWSGARGGRTVTVVFRDGAGRKLGTLETSAARVRWWGPYDKLPYRVSSRDLDRMFRRWFER